MASLLSTGSRFQRALSSSSCAIASRSISSILLPAYHQQQRGSTRSAIATIGPVRRVSLGDMANLYKLMQSPEVKKLAERLADPSDTRPIAEKMKNIFNDAASAQLMVCSSSCSSSRSSSSSSN